VDDTIGWRPVRVVVVGGRASQRQAGHTHHESLDTQAELASEGKLKAERPLSTSGARQHASKQSNGTQTTQKTKNKQDSQHPPL
jgi:hypothetical protein